ncbi:MAG: nodulation protein NfeD [Thiotrichales bacterium]
MARIIWILFAWIVAMAGMGINIAGASESRALMLQVRGAIGPATQDLIERTLERAHDEDAAALVLQLDTPGGLDHSMRGIIRDILASKVPVVTYVAPSGSRAASAGTYILYASHVAAMAPATNLGSATPVRIGGLPELPSQPKSSDDEDAADSGDAMERKLINDAAAYIKGLARMHGRNEIWAEQAVREAVSLTSSEALEMGVIDVIANDTADLLRAIDGRKVNLRYGEITLATRDLPVEVVTADWRTELLSVITDPNVAYIMLLLGIYGLIFEFSNPGYIVPGVVGAISLLLALYALQVLPFSYAGIALLFVGVAFMVAEAFVPSGGILGVGGLIAFVIGSVVLFDDENLAVSIPTIGGTALVSAIFMFWVINRFIRLRRRPAVSGIEALIGADAEVLEDFVGRGRVRVAGEIWSAHSASPVRKGQIVSVASIDNLIVEIQSND